MTSTQRPSRLRRLLRALGVLTLVGVLLLGIVVARSAWEVSHTRVEHLQLSSEKVAGRGLRLVQLTDLHDVQFTPQRDELVTMVRDLHPDAILLTGDFVNMNTEDMTRIDAWFAKLAALGLPMYAVPGNHDHFGDHYPRVLEVLERHGVHLLVDRHEQLDGPWGQLDVIGTDDYYDGLGNLPRALTGTRPSAYHLVLTHAPGITDTLADTATYPAGRVDLVICGHTHGGQVRVPGIGALYAPGGGFLPTYDKGLFTVGASKLWIDSGVGQSLPLRLNDQSQITLLEISPA